MEHKEQYKELSLLRARGTKLCLAIVGPSWVRNHLLERIRAAAIRHIKKAKELAALQAVVTSTAELVLLHSPDETFRWKSRMS
jgi:sugar phosphate isomerase/epimerase